MHCLLQSAAASGRSPWWLGRLAGLLRLAPGGLAGDGWCLPWRPGLAACLPACAAARLPLLGCRSRLRLALEQRERVKYAHRWQMWTAAMGREDVRPLRTRATTSLRSVDGWCRPRSGQVLGG